jgi:hypothetical protein
MPALVMLVLGASELSAWMSSGSLLAAAAAVEDVLRRRVNLARESDETNYFGAAVDDVLASTTGCAVASFGTAYASTT